MAYDLYLNGVLMPVTPGKIQTKLKGNNKTIELINEGEVNVIKPSGLTEFSFELLFPFKDIHLQIIRADIGRQSIILIFYRG